MTNFSAWERKFPEIYLHRREKLTSSRMILGALTIMLVCFCIFVSIEQAEVAMNPFTGGTKEPFRLSVFLFLQFITLLLYGSYEVSSTLAEERQNQSWDLKKLTPQTPFQMSMGTMLGAPIFAFFLTLCFFPAVLLSVIRLPPPAILATAFSYVVFLALSFLTLSASLLFSVYSNAKKRSAHFALPLLCLYLIGYFSIIHFSSIANAQNYEGVVSFYGAGIPMKPFWFLSSVSFGLWAFYGAKWRIAREFSPHGRGWRLPAFTLYSFFYILGFEGARDSYTTDLRGAGLVCASICVIAALCNPESIEHFRAWLRARSAREKFDRTPAWIIPSVLTLLLVAIVPMILRPEEFESYLIPFFTIRDLCFLQWCRFTKSEKPEVMAILYVSLAYILPSLVLLPMSDYGSSYTFVIMPMLNRSIPLLLNFVPVTLQICAIVLAMVYKLRQEKTT